MMRAVRRSLAFEALRRSNGGERADSPRDLFAPLDDLLVRGGDVRLALDAATRTNDYGCGPSPAPELLSFASSTATPISERAYARAELAREELMRASIEDGFEEAYDARLEEMRGMLRAHLQLSAADADVVFSPSGTDSQLHALFLARTLLGDKVTTIVVGSDQTGSGTVHTSRGCHFGPRTVSGRAVEKDSAIAGLSGPSIALPLCDGSREIRPRADIDDAVIKAVDAAVSRGGSVLLQIMDSSKLGWRAPGEMCLREIARRWPGRVQVAVDACQMRLGHTRMRAYLNRGYMVLISGSKYLGGPAFSGALLVPVGLAAMLDRPATIPSGFLDYASRSDWPKGWSALRARFPSRLHFGQWLRWEAALDEMGAYYRLPAAFRARATRELSAGFASLIALSPSLRPVEPMMLYIDEEFAVPTILPFTINTGNGPISAAGVRKLHRALMQDLRESIAGSAADREVAASRCLIGQPVSFQTRAGQSIAALRLCVGARHVIDAWSYDPALVEQNLVRELDRAAQVVAKIELLLQQSGWADGTGYSDER